MEFLSTTLFANHTVQIACYVHNEQTTYLPAHERLFQHWNAPYWIYTAAYCLGLAGTEPLLAEKKIWWAHQEVPFGTQTLLTNDKTDVICTSTKCSMQKQRQKRDPQGCWYFKLLNNRIRALWAFDFYWKWISNYIGSKF